ncbi:MAG: hypothetical protein NVS4B11_32470 [Ktedonobacteraceae bacterium]
MSAQGAPFPFKGTLPPGGEVTGYAQMLLALRLAPPGKGPQGEASSLGHDEALYRCYLAAVLFAILNETQWRNGRESNGNSSAESASSRSRRERDHQV